MVQCIAYFGKTYEEAWKTTMTEYFTLVKARRLKNQDEERYIHLLAWKMQEVQATRKVGKDYKPYFKNFREFYDGEEEYYRALLGNEMFEEAEELEKMQVIEFNRRLNMKREEPVNTADIEEQNRRIEEAMKRKELSG